jgi:hypothetical protein
VHRAVGAVGREGFSVAAGVGIEDVKDTGPAAEGDMIALSAERDVQPHDLAVELLGGVEVVGVEARFEDEARRDRHSGMDVWKCGGLEVGRNWWSFPRRHAITPKRPYA